MDGTPAYTPVARALHWIVAVLVIGLIIVGFMIANMASGPLQDRLYNLHRSTGALVLLLAIIRLVYRFMHPPLPLPDDYREQLRSEIADFTNTGGRPGGAITAALFLKEFTGGLPWAHLDIAGTAWVEDAKPYQPKGASGVAVRTLAELAFTSDAWK